MNSYKKVVGLYKKAIESKLEDNLRLIAKKVGVTHVNLIVDKS
jgi:L-ribulose-5-phosphate 3-epimerase UlaE